MECREKNKKVVGFFSDELGGKFLQEGVFLRSKVYSMKLADQTEFKKCGGTTIRKSMTDFNFNLYRQVLYKEKIQVYSNQKTFRSKRHKMYLHSVKKKAFSSLDDKRFIKPCGVETLAHGHHEIPIYMANWPSQ